MGAPPCSCHFNRDNPSEKYDFVSWDYYSQYMKNMTSSVGVVPIIPYLFPIYGKNVPSHQPNDDHMINQYKPWGHGGWGHPWVSYTKGPYWWQWQPDEMCLDSTWTGTWKLLQHMYSTWMTVLYCAHRKSTVQKLWHIYIYVFWFTRFTRNDVSPGNAMFSGVRPLCKKDKHFERRSAPKGPDGPVQILWNMLFQKRKQSYLKVHVFERAFNIYIYIYISFSIHSFHYTYHFLYIHFTVHTIFYTFISLYIPFFCCRKTPTCVASFIVSIHEWSSGYPRAPNAPWFRSSLALFVLQPFGLAPWRISMDMREETISICRSLALYI